jgi:type III secretory pathway component EscV
MDEKNFLDHVKPVSIRFTADEAEFINENYERVADTPERITYRDFFFAAVQKSVSRVTPKVPAAPSPEDAKEIESLRVQLQEAKAELDGKLAFIDEITQRNVNLDMEVDRLTQQAEQQAATIDAKEREAAEKAGLPSRTLVLENMQDVETALVMEYARLMGITPKEALIEKLFVPTVWHGPGDYIPRLTGAAKRKIREAFQ